MSINKNIKEGERIYMDSLDLPFDAELFIRFNSCLFPGEDNNRELFENNMKKKNLKIEVLRNPVIIRSTEAYMTGKLTDTLTGKSIYIRNYFMELIPKQ